MDKEKSKTLGIIGGAGPMAGLLLARKVIELCQKDYSCARDADFPSLILLSVPFAEMLQPETAQQDELTVSRQLKDAAEFLLDANASCFAIACNTLHSFLEDSYTGQLVSLLSETERFIASMHYSKVLVLASCTSVSKKVYDLDCSLQLPPAQQEELDALIARVLAGDLSAHARKGLRDIVHCSRKEDRSIDAVLLGCTELSLLMDGAKDDFLGIDVIDPLEIVARSLCRKFFESTSVTSKF
jgi:aspartate racemase